MNYVNITTRALANVATIRALYPLTAIPEGADLTELDYAMWQETPQPDFDLATHKAVEGELLDEGATWVQQWDLVPLSEAEISDALAAEKARLIAAVTARRWEVETGGIAFPDGTRIGTTIDDQNRITAVIANAELAGVTSVDFKAASGWVSLTLDEVRGVAAAIAVHVQGCFSEERAHHEAIEALQTLADVSAYDISAGWPQ